MFGSNRPDQEPELGRERRCIDTARARLRTHADHERLEHREMLDGTRQMLREDRQALESLRRERASDDASLRVERNASDLTRTEERSSSDARIAREKLARLEAEDETRQSSDRESLRREELGEVLALVEAQIEIVTATIEGDMGNLGVRAVATLRTARLRLRQLLEDVRDPEDTGCRYHDVGGSG